MSRFSKKAASAFLAISTVISLTGAGSLISVAGAQTTADLQAQISALLAQISTLQAQLNGGATVSACAFTRDLTVGATGADVTCLQGVLIAKGYLKIAAPTGYFGALTKAAVAAWQAASGVSPAVGYFGPKSRAAFAAMGGGTVIPGLPNTTGNLVVAFAGAGNSSAVAGAGQINAGRFSFTAPATTGVTITGLTFKKVGVLSDSNINNLYLADASTGQVVAQFQSLTNGVATFSGLSLNVAAGTTWTGELRMDLASGAGAGNTIGWQLTNVAVAAGSVAGLPVTASSLTVTTVSNPSIATIALTETIPNATTVTVDAGTQTVLVSSWTANVTNSKVRLNNLQFTFVGSANAGDIKNLQLRVNGTTVATVAQASTETNFQVPGGITLNTGNSTIEIYADVLGSPNRTFRLSLLQPYKVNAVDTQYNTGITASITQGSASISINTGSITVSLASDSPTQPVPVGASAVTIMKARIYAAGEPVKVLWIDGKITANASSVSGWDGTTVASYTDDVSNIRIIDDVGGQVGNTISTISSGATSGTCTLGVPFITCHFGVSGSPINYIVPANTARTLSLLVDIGSAGNATTLQGSFPAQTSNLQGQTSFAAASSGLVTGAVLQVSTSPLVATLNNAFANPTYVAGSSGVKIASFSITAASAQGARISSLTFDKDATSGIDMQNMRVMIGGVQFGATRNTLSTTAAETSLNFSGNPVSVPAGGSVTVDVYADILTSSTASATYAAVFDLIGWSALGAVSNSSITFPTTGAGYSGSQLLGQSVTLSSGPTVTIAAVSGVPGARQVPMSSTGNTLLAVRFTANNVEDVKINNVTFLDTMSNGTAGVGPFTNLTLWNGSTQVSGPLPLTVGSATTGTMAFALNPVTVPKNGSVILTVKGDAIDFSNASGTDNIVNTFSVNSTTTVTAVGVSSNGSATVSGTASGDALTLLRSKVNVTASVVGLTTSRPKSSNDYLANLVFSVPSGATPSTVGTVILRFAGSAVTGTFQTYLLNSNGAALGSSAASASCVSTGNSCSVTFGPQIVVDASSPVTAQVKAVTSAFADTANTADPLSISINSASDVLFNDGTTGSLSLETTATQFFPFPVADVSYP